MTFAALFVSEKRDKGKEFLFFLKDSSSVTLRAPPSPTGEGWQNALIPSAHILAPRPPCTFSGRAGNACTNLLGSLVRYVRTRGIAEATESGKTTDFRYILCRTHLPRMARATNSCTRKEFFKRGELTNARSALVGVAETGGKSPLK